MATSSFTLNQTHHFLTTPKALHHSLKPLRLRSTRIHMSLQDSAPSLAVVGVTGAVGQEFLSVLTNRDFPYSSIKLLASKRSAGKTLTFENKDYVIQELTEDSFDDVDIALFSAGGSISKKYGPIAVQKGTIVVDNSSAFRMVDGVPLVIPEVNPEAMDGIKVGNRKGALIANPNCSTIICLMAATPLHKQAKVTRMVVSTYQAASGAGAAAMEELELQTREVLQGKPPTCNIFSQQYAFNLFSHNAPIQPNGYNEEEMKLVKETRKIWNDKDVKVTATCIRVPVMRAHAESVNLQFEKPLDENTAKDILKNAPGVVVIDERATNHFPTPLEVSNKDDVAVGRIRRDLSQEGDYGLDIFVCGDQIRKGAALNAIQIAEMLLHTSTPSLARNLSPPPQNMETVRTVKDAPSHGFVKSYAAHLKRSGKIELPPWTDIVKTGVLKELAPYDPDWYYIRAASIARKIYLRGGLGVGSFKRIYGGSKRNGSRPRHFGKSSGSIARHILQQLEKLSIIEQSPNGGRRITSTGRRDLDQVSGRIAIAL
ncbi:hypothetical protein ACFE04_010845 [Oxalis oulophora]